MNNQVYGAFEGLLLIALSKGYAIRGHQPMENISKAVGFHLQTLDEHGVSWTLQNRALQYINNIEDPKIWDEFFKKSIKKLIQEILTT